MFCAKCGKENTENNPFCKFCGSPMSAETPAAPSVAPPTGPGPGMAGPPPPQKKSKVMPLIIALIAVVVVAAVALVLIFVVFNGGGAASGPEQTVDKFLRAVEQQNDQAIVDLIDPAMVRELRSELGSDFAELLADEIYASLPGEDVKFTGAKYKTQISGNSATVTIVAGTIEYTDFYGDRQKESVDETDVPQVDLIKTGDTWYLDFSSAI